MTATAMQQTPSIPPRPSRSQDKADSSSSSADLPKVPPRPATKRLINRSISPNPDRFAPSPLSAGIPIKSPKTLRFSDNNESDDPIDRPGSVTIPALGEEGREYSAITEEYEVKKPEQTSTVAEDLKLHAPKPSLPAQSAKQRVQAVTRTDSEKAASYGIGRPASVDGSKKGPGTSISGGDSQADEDENHGIPEIGQRVPMNPHLGDVQAPSPAPGTEEFKHHHRKTSSRGGPPGSYGLHGHGVVSQDKFDKQYYEKNPHVYVRENRAPLHDRQNDYAMSSNDLNQLVRDTPSRAGNSTEYQATPSEEVGFQASEEYTSRISSPHHTSTGGNGIGELAFKSEITSPDGERTVHVDDPEHPEYRSPGDIENDANGAEHEYTAPILAADEVDKSSRRYVQQPAVHPPLERRGSASEMEEPRSQPSSRPTSLYRENPSQEFSSTPLEDVKEYEPLFSENEAKKREEEKRAEGNKARHYFPSKDIWEDAPESVHYMAEVSTPDVNEHIRTLSAGAQDRPKTPAHIFAQRYEELAEREVQGPADVKANQRHERQIWSESQPESESFLAKKRPVSTQRFPSRDIWEDVPESQLYETTVSSEQQEESKPDVPSRPAKKPELSEKPAIPGRPKPKQTSSEEEVKTRPPISDKPKPQIPARPARSSAGESDGARPKPPVPNRPMGSKIAALQAGFMSDLNKRLQLGPQAPKKEEPSPQEDLTEEKEKAPLSDARKSRARGPQRRAPAKSPAPATSTAPPEPAKGSVPALSFSITQTFWSIDPDSGSLVAACEEPSEPTVQDEEKVEPVEEKDTEVKVEAPIAAPVEAPIETPVEELVKEKVDVGHEEPVQEPVEESVEESKAVAPEESKPIEEKVDVPEKIEAEPEPEPAKTSPPSTEVVDEAAVAKEAV
ncbi:altered inheritance of mitochondria protein 21 [Mariannaea sp. PMI_226]|nr:altered inheritance of mitochondria protein 21 [Mariannaea sp. PMI_226]